MFASLLLVMLGAVLLYAGADVLVRGSSNLALRAGLTPLIVGLTVVATGTSAPELVVSVAAALRGEGGIAAGNVVGSNIANVGLILAISALMRPLLVDARLLRAEIPFLIGVTLLCAAFLLDGRIGRIEATALVAGLIIYLTLSLRAARRERPQWIADTPVKEVPGSYWRDAALVISGTLLLLVGAQTLVRGGSAVALVLGIPPVIVGLSLVALGTSLPELATSILAALRGNGDLALGNVVGSNLFNILAITGIAGLARPFEFEELMLLDLAVLIGSAALLLPLAATKRVLSRTEGGVLLLLYLGYAMTLAVR